VLIQVFCYDESNLKVKNIMNLTSSRPTIDNIDNNVSNNLISDPNLSNQWYMLKINIFIFFILWFVYIALSYLGLIFSSGGWTGLIIGLLGLLFYGGLFAHVFFVTIKKLRARDFTIYLDLRIVLILIFLQLLAYTGNVGDCGDDICNYPSNFGYRMMLFLAIEETALGSLFASVTSIIGPIAAVGYFFTIFPFLTNVFSNRKTYQAVKYILLLVIVVGVFLPLMSISTILDDMRRATAIQYSNVENCKSVFEYDKKKDCYIKIVKKTRDYKICDNIPLIKNPKWQDVPLEGMRNTCYKEIIKEIVPSHEECNRITTDINIRDSCYSRIADKKACDSIAVGYGFSKPRCYFSAAISTNDYTLCQFALPDDIDSCYQIIGVETKNKAICELIKGDTIRRKNCLDMKDPRTRL